MKELTDFLNHGLLPFTGRAADVERLLNFWRGSFDAQELRTALLLGEAGIGKSRLLDETLRRIIDSGGCVIHAKLVPESTTSLVPLITRGLLYSDTTRRFFRDRPGPTVADAIGMLRRVSRLFPTLLVLEDIHLIAGDTLRELATLLDAVADEKLSLLCLSRPVELAARAVIERSIVEEIELTGFDGAEISDVWLRLFNAEPDGRLADQLREITGGNPLALRSMLRGAIASKAIVRGAGSNRWHLTIEPETFLLLLRRNVDLLVEGMAAHLTERERRTATLLASLGEVFADESAELLSHEVRGTIRSLTFKGILAPASTVSPLLGSVTSLPHTFTHTLLHQHLVAVAEPPVDTLIAVIAEGRPLYSALPFRLILAEPVPEGLAADTLARAVERTIDSALRLDLGPDWRLALEILKTAWHLFDAVAPRLDATERDILEASLLSCMLSLERRAPESREFSEHLDRLLELTDAPRGERMLLLRLRALRHLHVAVCQRSYADCAAIWRRVDALIEEHPELTRSEPYLRFLEQAARAAQGVADEATLRRVDTRLTALLDAPDLSPSLRSYARERVAASLLQLFDTPEELERKLALAREMSSNVDGRNAMLAIHRLSLLHTVGRMTDALESATQTVGHFRGMGLASCAAHSELIALAARAALEPDLAAIEREAAALGSGAGYPSSAPFRAIIGIYLGMVGVLRGAPDWTRRIDKASDGAALSFCPEGRLVITADRDEMIAAIEALPAEPGARLALRELGLFLAAGDTGARAASLATTLLGRPLLRLEDLVMLRATISLLDGLLGEEMLPLLAEELRLATLRALEWLHERRLHPIMTALMDRHRDLLARKETTAWRSRIRALAEERRGSGPVGEAMMRVSMMGTITVVGQEGEARVLRGARAPQPIAFLQL